MSDSEDIQNLFGKFDGQSQQYQEVARDDQASEARSRWPLLSSLALSEIEPVPDVGEASAQTSSASSAMPLASSSASSGASSVSGARPSSLFARAPTTPVSATPSDGGAPSPSSPLSPATLSTHRSAGVSDAPQPVHEQDVPSAPASLFSPPRAPEPEVKSGPLPFLRGAAPAFRVPQRPAPAAPAGEAKRPVDSKWETLRPADSAPRTDLARELARPADPAPPPVTRRAATTTTFSRSIQEPTSYPPVVTPETSRRHSTAARDFAPPIVPVNQYKPSATPITGVEGDPPGSVGDGRRDTAHAGSTQTDMYRFDTTPALSARTVMDGTATNRTDAASLGIARPASILGKLFAPPAPAASQRREPAPGEPRTRELSAVFSRLAGGRGRDHGGEAE